MKTLVESQVKGCKVLVNEVPKSWAQNDLYTQMVYNENLETECFVLNPKMGAFEVSYKGIVTDSVSDIFIAFVFKTLVNPVAQLQPLSCQDR